VTLEVFMCEQGTPEWHLCRAGIPTASEFDSVLAKGRGKEPSKTRRTYLMKCAAEILTGNVVTTWAGNEHTERGHALEPEARALYAFLNDVQPQQVGFLRLGRAGASPDSLVGSDGLLEIKTKLPHLQVEVLDAGEVPAHHLLQLQGQLWVSGRAWVDFMSYWPGLPPFIKRVERDEETIERIAAGVAAFNIELDALVSKLRPHLKAAA
jgi:hypothetical protein